MKEDEHCAEKEQDKSTAAPRMTRKRNVGAIIGKGGESIVQAQEDTTALIKLSKAHDLYPGTLERVCLIQGTREAVTSMHNYIMNRMLEKPDCPSPHCHPPATGHVGLRSFAQHQQHQQQQGEGYDIVHFAGVGAWVGNSGGKLSWGRHKQVKILVPNCTAGLVIGKEGSYVKEIKEKTGAFIQISQKSQTISLLERCITIAGEPDQCRAAVDLVIAKIAEDPQSTSCPTISYSHVRGPVASAYPTGSPFAVSSTASVITPSPSTAPASLFAAAAAAAAASQRYAAAGMPTGPPGDAFIPSGAAAAMVQQPAFPPYQTALFHAALAAVQAGAGIDHHQQQQAQQPRSFYPGYTVTSAQPLPPQAALMFTSATTQSLTGSGGCGGTSSGGSASSVQSIAGAPVSATDISAVYHTGHQLIPAQWPTVTVGAGGGHLTEMNVGYEASGLPAPLNFAYYSANQPLLTSIPSRHHGDVFPASCLDPFSATTGYQQQHSGYHHQHLTQSTPIVAAGAPQVYTSSACFVQTNLTSDSGISSSTGGGPSFGLGGSGSSRSAEPTTPLAAYSLTGAATSPAAQQQQLADYLSAVHLLGGGATSTYTAGQVARSAGDQLTTDFNPAGMSGPALASVPQPASGQQQQIPPPVTGSCGPSSFALQPTAGFAMPHQFQFQTAAAPAGWYPSAMSTPFALDHRSIPANIVDTHVVVSQHQQQLPPQEHRQQQAFTSGKRMTASPTEPIASASSTLGCSSSRPPEVDGAIDGDAASTVPQLAVVSGDDSVLGVLAADQRSTAASPTGNAPSHGKGTAVNCAGPRSTVEQTPPGSILRGHQSAITVEQQQPVCTLAPTKAVLSNGGSGHNRQPPVVGTGANSGSGRGGTSEVVSTDTVGSGSGEDSSKTVALNGVSG